jgi:hypothetical protein
MESIGMLKVSEIGVYGGEHFLDGFKRGVVFRKGKGELPLLFGVGIFLQFLVEET